MATELAKAYVQIIPSAEGMKKQLEDILGDDLDGAGKSSGEKSGRSWASAFGKASLAALGSASVAVGALAKTAADNFAEYEQLAGGAELLFGTAYDTVAAKAADAYKTVQMSQSEYLQQVNGFSVGLKTALGGNEQAAAELADKIVTAEADIVAATGAAQENVQNAFNGIMKGNYTMLDNLQLGITPTKEGFQDLIDKVNDWNATNGEATHYVIDNLADCQSALVDYIDMQGLAGYAGAEASDTIQGSLASLKAAWSNLTVGLATDGADIGKLVSNLMESAGTAAGRLLPVFQQALSGIGAAIGELAPQIARELPAMVNTLLPDLLSAGGSMLSGIMDGILALLPELPEIAFNIISQLAESLTDNLPELLDKGGEALGGFVQGIMDHLPDLAKTAIVLMVALANSLAQMLGMIVTKRGEVLTSFTSGIRSALGKVSAVAQDIVNSLWNGLRNLAGNALSWGRDVIDSFTRGIREKISSVTSAVSSVASKVRSFLHFSEPDEGPLKDFHTYAPDMVKSFAQGILDSRRMLTDALASVTGDTASVFNGIAAAGSRTTSAGTPAVPAASGAAIAGPVTMNIYASEGMDVDRLAEIVMRRLTAEIDRRERAFA